MTTPSPVADAAAANQLQMAPTTMTAARIWSLQIVGLFTLLYPFIAIDFQHKAGVDGKAWGLRSIKLKFSRKLLYFAAVAAIAETARPLPADERRARLLALFALPPLQRIRHIAADAPPGSALAERTAELFAIYEFFLAQTAVAANRRALEEVCEERRADSPLYMALRRSSKAFSAALRDWLRERYPAEHPIHDALLF